MDLPNFFCYVFNIIIKVVAVTGQAIVWKEADTDI
jgi:hypothetical protein